MALCRGDVVMCFRIKTAYRLVGDFKAEFSIITLYYVLGRGGRGHLLLILKQFNHLIVTATW